MTVISELQVQAKPKKEDKETEDCIHQRRRQIAKNGCLGLRA